MKIKNHNSKLEELKQSKITQNNFQTSAEVPSEWTEVKTSSKFVKKRSQHASCIHQNNFYVYGGYQTDGSGILGDFLSFNIQDKKWTKVADENIPGPRHLHSLICYKEKIFMFGGLISTLKSTNKVFCFDINKKEWQQVLCKGIEIPAINSHKSILFSDQMLIVGGQNNSQLNAIIYSLDLEQFQWKIFCQMPIPRIDFSLSQRGEELYLFGGKKHMQRMNDLWKINLKQKTFTQIQVQFYINPIPISGHCSVIFQDHLVIFGGTSGITHERNELFVYNIQKNYWQRHWKDSNSHNQNGEQSTIISRIKKEKQNLGAKKKTNSSFCLSKSSKQKTMVQPCPGEALDMDYDSSPTKKYRRPMKKENYYNYNFPFYGDKNILDYNKHRKNDLIMDLEKQEREERTKTLKQKTQQVPIHLSQSFQSLHQSVLHTVLQNNSRVTRDSNVCEEKTYQNNYRIRQPKARDGHTAELYRHQIVIFGGDRHHMSFNDILLIDLNKVLSAWQEEDQAN